MLLKNNEFFLLFISSRKCNLGNNNNWKYWRWSSSEMSIYIRVGLRLGVTHSNCNSSRTLCPIKLSPIEDKFPNRNEYGTPIRDVWEFDFDKRWNHYRKMSWMQRLWSLIRRDSLGKRRNHCNWNVARKGWGVWFEETPSVKDGTIATEKMDAKVGS